MSKYLLRLIAVILPICLIFSIGGAFAAWHYAGLQATDVKNEIGFYMNTFTFWEGADILPNEEGENHLELINNLLNGKDATGDDVGLNNPNSAISRNLSNRLNGGLWGLFNKSDHYGSMDETILDANIDMEGVFSTDTLGLEFIIQVVDDLTYYIFTTSVDLGNSGAPNVAIGQEVYPIYRSVIVRENTSSDFKAISTEIGHATSAYYTQLSNSSWLHDQTVPSFDVDTWKSCADTPIGNSRSNAIWTFAGDIPSAFADDANSFVYFRLDDAGNRTVTSENLHAEIKVTDQNGNVLAESAQKTVDGKLVVTVSFTIDAGDILYLEFTGSNYIRFEVT